MTMNYRTHSSMVILHYTLLQGEVILLSTPGIDVSIKNGVTLAWDRMLKVVLYEKFPCFNTRTYMYVC